jgi:NADH:ubiquinone oxidoreductase subunit 5 (subunit L)/multisubunit Na+/H+ antiporter MnhA subunit
MAGALFHLLNHSLFKPLLFLGAGALIHATGTRMIDRMGGMASRMPATSLLFLVGTIAICGLPPLNGFVSEFLLYIGFFSEARTAAVPYLAMGAPLLGLIGGLAVICFVKLYGMVFIGVPRTEEARNGHEASRSMLVPMGILGFLCVCAGLFPKVVIGILRPALFIWMPQLAGQPDRLAALPGLDSLTYAALGLLAAALILGVMFRLRLKRLPSETGSTWGCGYLAPATSMQYTSSSFGDIAIQIFKGFIRPSAAKPATDGFFPRQDSFSSHIPETLLEQILLPSFRVTGGICSFLRILQMGKVHIYMLYIFIVLVLLLIWAY